MGGSRTVPGRVIFTSRQYSQWANTSSHDHICHLFLRESAHCSCDLILDSVAASRLARRENPRRSNQFAPYMPSEWLNTCEQINQHQPDTIDSIWHLDGLRCFRRCTFTWVTRTFCRSFTVFVWFFFCDVCGSCVYLINQRQLHRVAQSDRTLSCAGAEWERRGIPFTRTAAVSVKCSGACKSYHLEAEGNTTCGEQAYFKMIIIQHCNFLNVESLNQMGSCVCLGFYFFSSFFCLPPPGHGAWMGCWFTLD